MREVEARKTYEQKLPKPIIAMSSGVPARHTMIPSRKVLGRELIRYMVGLQVDEAASLARYRPRRGPKKATEE
jgi:hypothetical protein